MAYRYNFSNIGAGAEVLPFVEINKAQNKEDAGSYLLSSCLSSRSSGDLNTERLIASANDIMSETLSVRI